MKVFSGLIRLQTDEKTVDLMITDKVEAIVAESKVEEGIVVVFTGHTTASVHLNNADAELGLDLQDLLSELVPNKPTYRHNKGEYGRNGDAHIKSLLVGNEVTVPVSHGRLALGQWQAVYFSEFDGPRARLVSVKVIGLGVGG